MLTDLLTWNTWKTPMPKSRSKNAKMLFAIAICFPLEPGHFWAPDWYFFIVIPLSFFFYFIDVEIENVQERRMFWKGPCTKSISKLFTSWVPCNKLIIQRKPLKPPKLCFEKISELICFVSRISSFKLQI